MQLCSCSLLLCEIVSQWIIHNPWGEGGEANKKGEHSKCFSATARTFVYHGSVVLPSVPAPKDPRTLSCPWDMDVTLTTPPPGKGCFTGISPMPTCPNIAQNRLANVCCRLVRVKDETRDRETYLGQSRAKRTMSDLRRKCVSLGTTDFMHLEYVLYFTVCYSYTTQCRLLNF